MATVSQKKETMKKQGTSRTSVTTETLKKARSVEFSSDDDETEVEQLQAAPRASTERSLDKGDKLSLHEKYFQWVSKMSDQNLFDALSACNRKPGPIVDSTRAVYQKMMLDFLESDQKGTVAKIDEYLAQNPEAQEGWIANGLEAHETNGVTNGNTENGYSDSDDEEAVETASRASRSSSKRSTPARSPGTPQKAAPSTTPVFSHKSDTPARPRRLAAREEIPLESEEDRQGPFTHSKINTFQESDLYSSPKFNMKPAAIRRRMVENYEESRSYREITTTGTDQLTGNHLTSESASKSKKAIFYILFLCILGTLGFAFYCFTNSNELVKEPNDELDILLESMNEGNGAQTTEI